MLDKITKTIQDIVSRLNPLVPFIVPDDTVGSCIDESDLVEFIMSIEHALDCEISENEITCNHTFAAVIELVKSRTPEENQ